VRQVDSCQNAFSLLEQGDRWELLPWLQDMGVGYLAYGPLGFGILTGVPSTRILRSRKETGATSSGRNEKGCSLREHSKRTCSGSSRLKEIGGRLGVGLAPLALR
jgi:aryl-alcohol dehydrogenase-like predicted oxidoreductase